MEGLRFLRDLPGHRGGRERLLVVMPPPSGDLEAYEPSAEQARERLLVATADLQRSGRLEVEFLEPATADDLRLALVRDAWDAVHFAGPFRAGDDPRRSGVPLADGEGGVAWLPAAELAATLNGVGLVVLDAAASVPAPSTEPLRLAHDLAACGLASTIRAVPDAPGAARIDWMRALYGALGAGPGVGGALREPAHAVERLFGRRALLRRVERDVVSGACRAVVVHGPPGAGKTTLAAELGRQLAAREAIEAVHVFGCTPSLTVDHVLGTLADWLHGLGDAALAARVRQPVPLRRKTEVLLQSLASRRVLLVFDGADRMMDDGVIARGHRARPNGRAAGGSAPAIPWRDAHMADLWHDLARGLPEGSAVVFTSQVDFDPLSIAAATGATIQSLAEAPSTVGAHGMADASAGNRPAGTDRASTTTAPSAGTPSAGVPSADAPPADAPATGTSDAAGASHVALGPLSFPEAVQWMWRIPGLAELPLRAVGRSPSMRRVYERIGGLPGDLALVARWAMASGAPPVEGLLQGVDDLAGSQWAGAGRRTAGTRRLSGADLVDRLTVGLSPDARRLLHGLSGLDEPVPLAGVAWMVARPMEAVAFEVDDLEARGLLERSPAGEAYGLSSVVRSWARAGLPAESRCDLWRRAARWWLGGGRGAAGFEAELVARRYLFLAGEFDEADAIVQLAWDALLRAGQVERLLQLLNASVATLDGLRRAMALDRLAQTYQALGDDATAANVQEVVLAEYEAAGDWRLVVNALHQLGRLHQAGRRLTEAEVCYARALQLTESMGDDRATAHCLHVLGVLHQLTGDNAQALARFDRALALIEATGDRAGAVAVLHQLGMLHELQGAPGRALDCYEQALAIESALGDTAAMAGTLHQLGMLHELRGALDRARVCYEQSLAIAETLDDVPGMALSLHQVGLLHQAAGAYDAARACFERALALGRGPRFGSGAAGTLFQLGLLDEHEGDVPAAMAHYTQALTVAERAGERLHMARALGRLARLREDAGEHELAVANAARWMVVLNQMGSPDRDVAAATLVRLRRKMSASVFDRVFRDALVPQLP